MSSPRRPGPNFRATNLLLSLAAALSGWLVPADASSQSASTPAVALLAPLSGDHAEFGRRAARAVMMATRDSPTARVLVFDTVEAGPEAALAAALAESVVAVIGPVGELESRAVIAARGSEDTPLFTLCSVHGIEHEGPGVFRLRTSAADQAQALAGAVLAEYEARTFAVLAPDDAYGSEATFSFVRAVTAYGGTIDRVVRYETGEPDVSDPVGVLTGGQSFRLDVPDDPWRDEPESRVRSDQGDRSHPDALFIPEYADQVAAILPHLQFRGWVAAVGGPDVQLLGSSGWRGPLVEAVGDLAAGAQVVQVYHPDDQRPHAEAFALEYQVRYGEEPTEFDAQVFDAAAFVLRAVDAAGPNPPPDAVTQAAFDAAPHEGACGRMWVSDDGGVVRDLGLWEVDGGGFFYPIGVIEPPRPDVRR